MFVLSEGRICISIYVCWYIHVDKYNCVSPPSPDVYRGNTSVALFPSPIPPNNTASVFKPLCIQFISFVVLPHIDKSSIPELAKKYILLVWTYYVHTVLRNTVIRFSCPVQYRQYKKQGQVKCQSSQTTRCTYPELQQSWLTTTTSLVGLRIL